MFRPVLVTPPEGTPVSIEECKAHAIVDHNDDDALVLSYISAATAHLDGFRGILGRGIMTQTWSWHRERFERSFTLPVPDVNRVVIDYTDADGLHPQYTDTRITPVAEGTRVDLLSPIPSVEAGNPAPLAVQFTCGFGDTGDSVPWAIRVAIMQLARQMYDNRGGDAKMGSMMEAMIAPYRWVSV